MAASNIHNGWRNDPANSRLDMWYRGTLIGHISDCGIALVTGSGIVSGGNSLVLDSGSTLSVDGAAGASRDFLLDVNNLQLLNTWAVASAVNEFQIRNAATGEPPVLVAQGGDANVGLKFTTKGTGAVEFSLGGDESFALNDSLTNPLTLSASGAGDPAYLMGQVGATASGAAGSAGALGDWHAGTGGEGAASGNRAGGVGGAITVGSGIGGVASGACNTGNGGAGGVTSIQGGVGGAGGAHADSDGGVGGNLVIGPGAGGGDGGCGCAGADGVLLIQASDGGLGTAVATKCSVTWENTCSTVGSVQHTTAFGGCDLTNANTGILVIRIS